MAFAHDVVRSLDLLVDLVNTDPASTGEELLPDVDALHEFAVEHGVRVDRSLTDDHLAAVRRIRPSLQAVFLADTPEAGALLLNDLLGTVNVTPRLTDHDGYPLHVHYFPSGASLDEVLMIDGAMALSMVLTAGERDRLRVCAAPDCNRVLVDLSRNRSKRYCDSRTCGNRLHVAAYRERRRAAAAS